MWVTGQEGGVQGVLLRGREGATKDCREKRGGAERDSHVP